MQNEKKLIKWLKIYYHIADNKLSQERLKEKQNICEIVEYALNDEEKELFNAIFKKRLHRFEVCKLLNIKENKYYYIRKKIFIKLTYYILEDEYEI